jgi:selenide,water dikinase
VTVLESGAEALRGYPAGLIARVLRRANEAGILFRTGSNVERVEEEGLLLEGGERVEADLIVWATGAAPDRFTSAAPLPKDPRGFLLVRDTLEVEGCDGLFAAGDCAVPSSAPWVPRAGVYAVREGPVVERNVRAWLAGRPPERYRPQPDFLSLLNVGQGWAVGSKRGLSFEGAWVRRLKDRLDRAFVERFRL